MKTTITKAEHLQLIGLKALADKHMKFLDDIRESIASTLGAESDWMGAGDLVFDTEHTVDHLLKNHSITVADAD